MMSKMLLFTEPNTQFILHQIKELNPALENDFSGRRIYATEKLKGQHIRLFFSKKEIKIFSRNSLISVESPFYKKIYDICKNRYFEGFFNLYKEFEENDLLLILEMVGNEIGIKYFNDDAYEDLYLCDAYINTNWINWDDIIELSNKFGIKTAPLVFDGDYDREALEAELLKPSYLKVNQNKEGIVVKPYLEDYSSLGYNNRMIMKLTHPLYIKKEEVITSEKSLFPFCRNFKSGGEYLTKASEFLDANVKELDFSIWKLFLDERKIEIKKENIYVILPLIVKHFLEDALYKKLIDSFCKEKELDVNKFIKAIRKILPNRIKKEFNL